MKKETIFYIYRQNVSLNKILHENFSKDPLIFNSHCLNGKGKLSFYSDYIITHLALLITLMQETLDIFSLYSLLLIFYG